MLIDSEKLKKVLIERLGVSGFKAVEVVRDIEDQEVNDIAEDRPQVDIRWTDKHTVTSSGDIVDFTGQVVGHINLEYMKGGAE